MGQKREWGFKEVVKNPGIWKRMAKTRRGVDRAIQKAERWGESEIQSAVSWFVFKAKTKNDAWDVSKVLSSLGPEVHRHVLGLLRDPTLRPKLVKVTGQDLVPETPFNRACELLGDTPPSESVPAVTPFLKERSEYIRQDAAWVLGKVGSPETVPYLRKALSDSYEYVRSYALMGLQCAIKNQRLSRACRRELFDAVQRLVVRGKNADKSAALLVEFDPARSTRLFLSKSFFSPRTKSLQDALEALADRKISVPRERLLALVRELEEKKLKYPRTMSEAGRAIPLQWLGLQQNGAPATSRNTRSRGRNEDGGDTSWLLAKFRVARLA